MTSEMFNLYALIDEVAASSAATDPHILAKEITARIPMQELRGALLTALVPMIRTQTGLRANLVPNGPTDDPNTPRRVGRSRKFTEYARLDRLLSARIAIGGGEHKFLRQCTRANVQSASAIRKAHASATLANAVKLDALDGHMERLDVETVGELPPEVLREVFA